MFPFNISRKDLGNFFVLCVFEDHFYGNLFKIKVKNDTNDYSAIHLCIALLEFICYIKQNLTVAKY